MRILVNSLIMIVKKQNSNKKFKLNHQELSPYGLHIPDKNIRVNICINKLSLDKKLIQVK